MSEHFDWFGRQNKTTYNAVKRCDTLTWIDRQSSWWSPWEFFLLGAATNPVFQDSHRSHSLERQNLHLIWNHFSVFPIHCFYQDTLFPTCQVRVVRFYQSCSPPPPLPPPPPPAPPPPPPPPASPPPPLHPLPCSLPLCQPLFTNFRAQCALLDLGLMGPSQLSAHRWTSTWDLPGSVRTAEPQPGTSLAQCAPLDLNLGPSELSAHRWTSTWDLPSSDRMPEDMPDRMSDRMPEDMPDKMP